jgi:hypothetical protein
MRWHFDFFNKTGAERALWIDYAGTYLADEAGNLYRVLRDSNTLNPTTFEVFAPNGLRQKLWIEFPAPVNCANVFAVHIENILLSVRFPEFQIELPFENPGVPTATPTSVPSSERLYELNQVVNGTEQGFGVTLAKIVILQNGRMRWYFEFYNRTGDSRALWLSYPDSYLADMNGNRYAILADSSNTNPQGSFEIFIANGSRLDHWLEFPAPIIWCKYVFS